MKNIFFFWKWEIWFNPWFWLLKLSVLIHWMQRKKTEVLWKAKKIGQKCIFLWKKGNFWHFFWNFWKKSCFPEGWCFVRCNHCIMTLNLSYQNQWSDKIRIFPKNHVSMLHKNPLAIKLPKLWKYPEKNYYWPKVKKW